MQALLCGGDHDASTVLAIANSLYEPSLFQPVDHAARRPRRQTDALAQYLRRRRTESIEPMQCVQVPNRDSHTIGDESVQLRDDVSPSGSNSTTPSAARTVDNTALLSSFEVADGRPYRCPMQLLRDAAKSRVLFHACHRVFCTDLLARRRAI